MLFSQALWPFFHFWEEKSLNFYSLRFAREVGLEPIADDQIGLPSQGKFSTNLEKPLFIFAKDK